MNASETYQGRTYHAFRSPAGVNYGEGADIRTAPSIPHNAVPPIVRAALLTKLGTPSKAVEAQACRWFLKCENPATTLVSHPILGGVPACARCAARAQGAA